MYRLYWIIPTIVLCLFVALTMFYIQLALAANRAIDIHSENIHKQWLIDKANCESKNGVAIQSWWDGSISDCKFPPKETK